MMEFEGTRTNLQNQYFVIGVADGDPPDWIDTGSFPGTTIGKTLLGES